jgi:hypothetical protein
MIHPSDDKLLELALELFDDAETRSLQEHVSLCAECRARFERIRSNTDLLGSISPVSNAPPMPLWRARRPVLYPLLKAAALLVVGFLGGLAAADLVRKPEVNVVPSYLIVSSPPDSITRCPVSEATAQGVNLR